MPQATSELTKRWDGPSEEKALMHLYRRGYRLTKQHFWLPPKVPGGGLNSVRLTPFVPTEEDESAILFLIQEWDFGGLVT